jgi:hypothetical protein
VSPILADGPGTPVDQGVATVLFIAALGLGWIGVARLRGKGFRRLSPAAGWIVTGGAAACLVLAVVLPPIIRPVVASARPSTRARLAILAPRRNAVYRGDPANVPVRFRLTGGRIVPFTSRHLVSDEGHVHVFLDGVLVSMTTSLEQTILARPGLHQLVAEFVAVDHAPFDPPVIAAVRFRVRKGSVEDRLWSGDRLNRAKGISEGESAWRIRQPG